MSIERHGIPRPRWMWMALCGCCAVALGCGGSRDGPPRYTLSGTVTFDGKPVPYGTIIISPDSSQGNSGPGAFAQIRDGKYRTARGAGTVGGPHLLDVMGFRSFPGEEGFEPETGILFDSYELAVDLPMENFTYDIAVPAEAAAVR